MARDWPVIDADVDLQKFVDDHLLRSAHRCFVVEEDGKVVGLATPHEVKDIDRARWPRVPVREVMLPLDRLHSVQPNLPVTDALERMGHEDVNQLFVMSNRHLDGIISRGKYILVNKLGCNTSPCTALAIEVEKKIQGKSPENTNTG